MAQSGDTGTTTYAGIAVILMIAIGALVIFKFNVFDINRLLMPDDDEHRRISRNPDPVDGGGDGGDTDRGVLWSDTMPDASRYETKHERPLPGKLTHTVRVGEYRAEIELRLVPQGWFPLGENDGVTSNMPKRWVWLDDYYIAATEITNEQMYAFILADGYRVKHHWTQEGAEYATLHIPTRGTPHVGWTPLERELRLWALSSPYDDLTIQVLDPDKLLPVKNTRMLVLPGGGDWSDFFNYQPADLPSGRALRLQYREEWKDVDGETVCQDERMQQWVHTAGSDGYLSLRNIVAGQRFTVIAWPDGLKEPPLIGDLRRGESGYLRGAKMPAVGMSWFEADACCRFFGGMLPSEAQWEKAGRGHEGRIFPWGNEIDLSQKVPIGGGMFRLTSPHANLNVRRVAEVGSYPSGVSVYGVADLVGNVSEWCRDVYIVTPNWAEKNPVNHGGAKERRAERGSSTEDDDPQIFKLHNRRSSDPYKRMVDTRGFRMIMDAETALKLTGWK